MNLSCPLAYLDPSRGCETRDTSMKTLSLALAAGTLTAALAGALSASSAVASPYKHVLLISVDGLHALDLANYVATNPASSFAALAHTGIFYPNALTRAPSDS